MDSLAFIRLHKNDAQFLRLFERENGTIPTVEELLCYPPGQIDAAIQFYPYVNTLTASEINRAMEDVLRNAKRHWLQEMLISIDQQDREKAAFYSGMVEAVTSILPMVHIANQLK